ncbi:hypothetical protein CDAR_36251 [Caerostris darwini]|uniref:C2H2-type domain-containing protein n=1 Tax=Caerostris darwini TaxID=1538125 RepID=A0AAV4SFC0_9ARAC|nr:hypothetical protein CDAR_36251 [Caerostris darwini]
MNSTPFSVTAALDCFESSLDSSFSPICHRTRSQLAVKAPKYVTDQTINTFSCTDLGNFSTDIDNNNLINNDVGIAMDELLQNILPCTPPPQTQPSVTCHSSSPSTIIQIEDSESVIPHPRHPCDSPSTIVVMEDDTHCAEPIGLCHDTGIDEVALYPSDLEVRELFSDSPLCQRFDFINLTCIECRRRFYSVGGLENHLLVVHDIRLDNSNDNPSTSAQTYSHNVLPPPEMVSFGPTTGPPKCALSPAKTWATVGTSLPYLLLRLTSKLLERKSRSDLHDNPDEVSHVVLMPVKPLTKSNEHKAPSRRIT